MGQSALLWRRSLGDSRHDRARYVNQKKWVLLLHEWTQVISMTALSYSKQMASQKRLVKTRSCILTLLARSCFMLGGYRFTSSLLLHLFISLWCWSPWEKILLFILLLIRLYSSFVYLSFWLTNLLPFALMKLLTYAACLLPLGYPFPE